MTKPQESVSNAELLKEGLRRVVFREDGRTVIKVVKVFDVKDENESRVSSKRPPKKK